MAWNQARGMGKIQLKRIYDPPSPTDGQRVLVDRIWPRGISKEAAALDLWLKEIAPSSALRKWFGHDPGRFDEFRDRYRHELAGNARCTDMLRQLLRNGDLTLLYAARDKSCNHARVLAEYIQGAGGEEPRA